MSGAKKGGKEKKPTDKQKKVIEDKTFGLKNKNKSAKVQKYVQTVKTQTVNSEKKKNKEEPKVSKKEIEKQKLAEQNELFKPTIVQQKVPLGVDPKSVLCQFFKQGACAKGAKCKFSHDLAITRKTEKIDLYTDRRDIEEKQTDVIDNWDEKKLESVVSSKHATEKKGNETDIVCRHFLEAIEKRTYGWFWECPNGGDKCIYRHALPPGYVFKKKEVEQDPSDKPAVEESLENDRKAVNARTPVTLERFLQWREEKRKKKEEELLEKEQKRKQDIKVGKTAMSGREMFTYNPDLFIDDDAALDEAELEEEEDIDANVPHNVIEVSGTSLTLIPKFEANKDQADGTQPETKEEIESLGVEINESLFNADDLPDDE